MVLNDIHVVHLPRTVIIYVVWPCRERHPDYRTPNDHELRHNMWPWNERQPEGQPAVLRLQSPYRYRWQLWLGPHRAWFRMPCSVRPKSSRQASRPKLIESGCSCAQNKIRALQGMKRVQKKRYKKQADFGIFLVKFRELKINNSPR